MALAIERPVERYRSAASRLSGIGYALPALLLILVFFVLPVTSLLLRSVLEPTPGLRNYVELLGTSTYLRIFFNTFVVSAWSPCCRC